MRILHISHLFATELEGGVQSYVSGLIAHQRAAGHDVHVLTGSLSHDGPARTDVTSWTGVPVTTLRRLPEERWSGDLGSERIGAIIDGVLADVRPDVCHVHHWQGLTNDVVRRAAAAGAKVVVTLHDLYTTCPRFFRMREGDVSCPSDLPIRTCAECLHGAMAGVGVEGLETMLVARHEEMQRELEAASVVTTMSRYMRDRVRAVPYFRRHEIEVLPIGVMHDGIAPVPPPPPVPGKLRIANWAGVDPRKGLHVLIDAVAGSEHASAFEVHIHGTAPEGDYVERLRSASGDADVRWRGPFAGTPALAAIAAESDLAVFPSLEEPYGLAQDEAMLLGMALVVSDQGAPPERVDGRAVVVPADDATALRTALERLLQDHGQLDLLRAQPCSARQITQHIPELMSAYRRSAKPV